MTFFNFSKPRAVVAAVSLFVFLSVNPAGKKHAMRAPLKKAEDSPGEE